MPFRFFAFFFFMVLCPVLARAETPAKPEFAYDRVTKENVIRCGYGIWPDFFEKDPNTGAFSGMWHEYFEMLAASLRLKVEWSAEVPYPEVGAALAAGRIDAYCMMIVPLPDRLRSGTFTAPILYVPLHVYARADDARLIAHPERLNAPETRIISVEGEATAALARERFPMAKLIEMPSMNGANQLYEDITSGKADVTFSVPSTFASYDAAHPGKLARLMPEPLGVFGASVVVPLGDTRLAELLGFAALDMLNTGKLEALLKKYKMTDLVLLPAKPYQAMPAH